MPTGGGAFADDAHSRSTSAVLVGQVRKPPDVAQAHSVADGGEDVLLLAGPVSPLGVLVAIVHVWVLHFEKLVRVVRFWKRQRIKFKVIFLKWPELNLICIVQTSVQLKET